MEKITVLTPSSGSHLLEEAHRSVLNQTIKCRHVIVNDGKDTRLFDRYRSTAHVIDLPDNTHQGEWYGHRIYADITSLIDADFLCFLDEDNTYQENHVEVSVNHCRGQKFAWSYRNLMTEAGAIVGIDDFESICDPYEAGYALIDTSGWTFSRDGMYLCKYIKGKWGADRKLTEEVLDIFNMAHVRSRCTSQHTYNYRMPQRLEAFFRKRMKLQAVTGDTTAFSV